MISYCSIKITADLILCDHSVLGLIALILNAEVVWQAAVAIETSPPMGEKFYRLIEHYLFDGEAIIKIK